MLGVVSWIAVTGATIRPRVNGVRRLGKKTAVDDSGMEVSGLLSEDPLDS